MEKHETISKAEWITIVQWISLRWDNLNWDDEKIKSLYGDFRTFPPDVVWDALTIYFDNGHKFFNVVEFRKFCLDRYQDFMASGQKILTVSEVLNYGENKGGLIEFLKANGYESFAHACWASMMKRFREGKAEKYENQKDWDVDEPWSSAKDRYLQTFSPEWTVEFLEARRDKKLEENHG